MPNWRGSHVELCGEKLDYSLIPNPIEWLALGDVAHGAYVG